MGNPGGSGLAVRTTTLRMVCGLERPTEGEIVYENRVFVSVASAIYLPPEKRNVRLDPVTARLEPSHYPIALP